MKAIRDTYGVPAKRGALVRFSGWGTCRILSADRTSMRLWIKPTHYRDMQSSCMRLLVHPTWEMTYLDAGGQ